ncbi:MAG: 50S ribosomal protein L17 [Candidatus Pacebacteria bacterium]|nr:50S ribosomal protein L17 [Candidatus Paceibacterota bacterium]
MRHHNNVKKFGREKNQRVALMQSLARNLIMKERITTTVVKAKALRPYVEKMVTKAKRGTEIAVRRELIAELRNKNDAAKKLIADIAPRYMERAGGYTRVMKLPPRLADGASMAIIEFV